MTSQEPFRTSKDLIEAALDEFCEAWFVGERLDPNTFCQSHPECGPELRERIESFLVAAEDQPGSPRPGGSKPAGVSKGAGISLGSVLGDFRAIREIGRGGMGSVYEAEQISLKRRVALKVLWPHLSIVETAVLKFRREAEAGSRQSHSGIVSVFAVGEQGGMHYIAQELVKGAGTLADKMDEYREAGTLPQGYFREAAGLIAGVTDALQHAHTSGVIHRDVKPSNILLTEKGFPKVSDFGLARVEGALALSRTGDFCGTPYYTSPEQAMSRRISIDHRTDIFSLGVTLYEALTLKRPFDGETSHEVLRKVLFHEPQDPRQVNSRVPRDLAVICLKAIEKGPKHRYQTMAELGEDLGRFLEGESILARPAGRIRKAANWLRRHQLQALATAASALAFLAIFVLAIVVFEQKRKEGLALSARFRPISEALDRPDYSDRCNPWISCLHSDPSNADGHLLKAIEMIDKDVSEWDDAARVLENCLDTCKFRDRETLKNDARYLLGLLELAEANAIASGPGREHLFGEARSVLREVERFDHTSLDAFLRRSEDPQTVTPDQARQALRKIHLNREHFLVHLYLGLDQFDHLYKGGALRNFQKGIQHLEKASEARPHDGQTLTYLGRTYYFFARHFNFLDLTERATKILTTALQPPEEKRDPLTYTTLGQIALLQGSNDAAQKKFICALEVDGGRMTDHIHNAYTGIAKVSARQGPFEETIEKYNDALKIISGDCHLNVHLGEFHFFHGNFGEAIKCAERGCLRFFVSKEYLHVSRHASARLLLARVHIEKGDYLDAYKAFSAILDCAYSPRDLGLACLAIATLPEEQFVVIKKDQMNWINLANRLVWKGRYEYYWNGRSSPIYLSAKGVSQYLEGEYDEAIRHFNDAMEERKKWWPLEVRKYHWADDARDLYLLAMAHFKLAKESVGETALDGEAREFFGEAETLFQKRDLPLEYSDINRGIRDKACEVLGFPP